MDLAQKIKLYRLELGWTQEDLANKSDISIQSIKRYETGKGDNITTANLEKLASVFNVSLTDFLDNSIVRKSNENLVRKSFVSNDVSPEKSEKLQKLRTLIDEQENRIINLRFFPSVSVAAGYGANNDDEAYDIVPITAKFLTKVLRVPVRQYDLINVFGDSMQPIIKNGDTLLVEPTHEARNGEIVIANISGDLYVKKLLRDPINREVKLTSMNELYKDIVMSGDELDMLKIVGVVRKVVPLGVLAL
ncbi:XRE family transcriptional regulator [Campylobacter sp. 7477a]|uniref:XRE family transcriptional regulator n=1 Tax=Campylobacter sp. 7477a TaxID=2735741 RepID=UPI0030148F09|nr:helix-turn-helix domain-containing protein [Campylobacter sp. 7477a]